MIRVIFSFLMAYKETSIVFCALKPLNKDNWDRTRALSWKRNKCPPYTIVVMNATRKAPHWLRFTLVAHRSAIRRVGGRSTVLVAGICTMESSRYPVSGRRCIVIVADAAATSPKLPRLFQSFVGSSHCARHSPQAVTYADISDGHQTAVFVLHPPAVCMIQPHCSSAPPTMYTYVHWPTRRRLSASCTVWNS